MRSQAVLGRLAMGAWLLLAGCAAMVRTWTFTGPPQEGPGWVLEVEEARVGQKALTVTLVLRDLGAGPAAVAWGRPVLTLPDGETLRGAAPDTERIERHLQDRLAGLGIGQGSDVPVLPEGGELRATMVFRSPQRDLRRQAWLELSLPDLVVDGVPQEPAPIRLTPPPEAPIGEWI